jgi:hypothetical protein
MTDYDIAETRGELFALKLIIAPCLKFLAAHYDDPVGFLATLEKNIVDGAKTAAPAYVLAQHQETFVRAATGWAATVIEGARSKSGPTPRLQ